LVRPGANDGPDELTRLLELFHPWLEATLHLLQYNPVPDLPWQRAGPDRCHSCPGAQPRHSCPPRESLAEWTEGREFIGKAGRV